MPREELENALPASITTPILVTKHRPRHRPTIRTLPHNIKSTDYK